MDTKLLLLTDSSRLRTPTTVVLLGLLAGCVLGLAGCATTSSSQSSQLSTTRKEVRAKPRSLVATLEGNTVTAKLSLVVECQSIVTSAVSEVVSGWRPCTEPAPTSERDSIADVPVTLKAGSIELTENTDAGGVARFDLGKLADSTSEPSEAELNASPSVGKVPTKTVSLTRSPVFDAWKKEAEAKRAKAEKQATEAAATQVQQQQAADRNRAERAHVDDIRTLTEVERGLAKFDPAKTTWTEGQLIEYARLDRLAESILHGRNFTDAEMRRLRTVAAKKDRIAPHYNDALKAALVRNDRAAVANGWDALKTQLVAPSTARLVTARIQLRCTRGHIISYEFDSQNRMGAMLRGKGVVKINFAGGYNARVEGEVVAGMSPYDIVLRAAQQGNCSELE